MYVLKDGCGLGGINYSYDNNGNLTYDGTRSYYYDCENRLITSTSPNYRWYRYDYLGRRVRKGFLTTWTKYCYDGDQVIAEYNSTNVLQRKYVNGPGIDEPIRMTGSSGTYYYHFDGLGSVVALSNSSGYTVERYSYDVFGEPNRTSNLGNPYLFTGRNYDSETGLYYYRARYYKPQIGRFLSPDPIGYVDGVNLYTYARNNPTMFKDPFGLSCMSDADDAYDACITRAVIICGIATVIDPPVGIWCYWAYHHV